MADNPASSSQNTAKSSFIGASRVFILTPEMLKKLGLAEKVQLIQNQIKPDNKVQVATEVKKSDLPKKQKKVDEKKSKKKSLKKNNKIDRIEEELPEKNESSVAKPLENDKLVDSNELDKEIKPQKSATISEELNLISEEVQSKSNFESSVKNLPNETEKIPSEDEKEDVERKLKHLFGDTSPQKLKKPDKSNEEDEDLEKSLKLSQSPEKKDGKSVQISEKSDDLVTKNSCDSSEIKSTEKIRSKFKPKIQWRSRKLPTKDEKKEILDSPKSSIENEERSIVEEELSIKSVENYEKIDNNLLNEGNATDEKPIVSSPKSADESEENLENKETVANLEPENVENNEEKGLNPSEIEISRLPEKTGSDYEESEEIIEETFEIIEEEEENFDEVEEQVSESVKNDDIEAADEDFVAETLGNENNDQILGEIKETMSKSSESTEELKSAVKNPEENNGNHEEGPPNEIGPKSPSNDASEAKNSKENNFPVELWEDDDTNGFGEIYCPSPRSLSGDEANSDLGPEILENREDNGLDGEGKEESGESPDAVPDEINGNGESLPEELEVHEEIGMTDKIDANGESLPEELEVHEEIGVTDKIYANDESLPQELGVHEEIGLTDKNDPNEGSSVKELEVYEEIGVPDEIDVNGESLPEKLEVHEEIGMTDKIDANDESLPEELEVPKEIGVTDKIDANNESSVEEPEVPKEIGENRLDDVEERSLCSLPEESSSDAMIEEISVEKESMSPEEGELLVETSEILEKVEENPLSEDNKKRSCSSSEDNERSEEIRDSNSGNGESVDEPLAQLPEFPERIGDNHLSKSEKEKLDSPTVPLLPPADKIGITSKNEDHSSVSAKITKSAESVKPKMNVSRQLFSESPRIAEEIEDSEAEKREELPEAPEEPADSRKQGFSDNLVNSNGNFLGSSCANEFEPILVEQETSEGAESSVNAEKKMEADNQASITENSSDNSKTFSDEIDANLVSSNGNTLVPSSPTNEMGAALSDERERSQEPLEALELRQKAARMNLLGLSKRGSVDSSLSRPPESLVSLGLFETPEIQCNDQVPLTSGMRKKRRNTLAIETIQEKPAKIARRGKRKSDVTPISLVPVSETITTPVRSSRRRSKPKIFEDCVSPLSTRRTSAASRRKQEASNNGDKVPENPVLPFENFPAISEDTESPKKLIIDESRFESDEESNFSESRLESRRETTIVDEVKTGESIEPEISEKIENEPKIDESAKEEFLDLETPNDEKETEENSNEICPVTQEVPKKHKKTKPKRRKGSRYSKKKSNKATKSSNKPENMIESPKITENSSEIPAETQETCESSKNSEQPETADEQITSENNKAAVPKTPEIPQLSADIEEKPQENPVETPPELSPQCSVINRESNVEIPNIAESSRSVASPPSTPQSRKRRGRPAKQPLITHFLRSSPASPYPQEDLPLAEAGIPSKTRGRKRKLAESADEAKVSENPEAAEEEENEETPRSRSRKTTVKPDETDGEGLSESDEDQSKNNEEAPNQSRRNRRSRGRRNGSEPACDRDYVPRLTKPSETVPVKPKAPPKTVKCGKCQEEMTSSAWTKHSLAKHNNMAWKDGEEKPDFDDERYLKNLLTRTKKKKASLVCESCGESKRSVVGFISHVRFCGKTELERQSLMWICPLCTAVLMPSSREYHEKQHRDEQLPKIRNFADGDRQKRRAAEKAVTEISKFTSLVQEGEEPPSKKRKQKATIQDFIQQPQMFKSIPGVWKGAWARALNNSERAHCRQPGCTFSSTSLEEICEHHSTCNFTPRVAFSCKICKFFSPSQSEIERHVRKDHSDKFKDDDSDFEARDSDASEYENTDGTKTRKICIKPKYIIRQQAKFLTDTFAYKKLTPSLTFIPSLKWTFDFELQHFSLHLFDELKPRVFTKLKDPEIYLPQTRTSMAMSNEKMNKGDKVEWKRWKRFESRVISDVPTFYTGGPVWALAWLTLPAALYDKQLDQYVAVSTHTSIGETYEVGKSHKFKNSIQIWRIGHLSYDSTVMEDPQLSYIVGHEYGTIWCMEWCPSGAYDHEDLHVLSAKGEGMKRMGLLAAASSSGVVLIYSLPFPSELEIPNDNYKSKIFKTEPIMILQVNSALPDESINWQCMKLSWSKTSGHDILVAGFSNGYVALWDLTTKSPIMRKQINESIYLDPYKYFYAHNHAVMFVELVPLEEKRYLATASMDRTSKTWDLEDTSTPVSSIKKGIAVDGVWMTHWPTSLTCYDDALTLQHTQTYATDVRGLPSRIIPLLPTNSTTYAIAKSDWSNGICHGTLAGEIIAAFPPQLLYLSDMHKWSKDRWLLTNIELVDFGKEKTNQEDDYHYLPESYDKCQKKFGIIYHDDLDNLKGTAWRKHNRRRGFMSPDTMDHSPIERYPFTSINRISWNTNAWSYLWLAVGYENGLVRILNLNRMSVSSIIDEMLSNHSKEMFKKSQEFDAT